MRTSANRWIPSAVVEPTQGIGARQLTRRDTLRLVGGVGLATAGLLALDHHGVVAQDAGTPPPAVTPQIGQRADGSTLWRVKVADMKMEQKPVVELHAFFPGEITVTEGDAIWFDFGMGGFHTASFLSGSAPVPFFITDPEQTQAEANSSGSPKLIFNPDIVLPQGGDTYDGTGYVTSGIDVFRDPTQPFTLTFSKAGTYDYACGVHGKVMKAKVIVQPAGTAAPRTQADYDRISADEMAKLYSQAEAEIAKYGKATSTKNADGTTTWEATVGAGGDTQVRVQALLPLELEVKVGDTVRWVHRSASEPHTVSFIGASEIPPEDPVEQFADGRPKFVQSMDTFEPRGGNVWSGKGWVSSGFLGTFQDRDLPTEHALTFDTPGEYTYFCFLHGDAEGNGMASKITVLPT